MTAEDIAGPSPANRPLAFPYNKWHSTQWTVNQAAALLFCSAQTAHRFGIAPDRRIFPRVGIESSQAVSLLRREQPHAWPAMGVLARAAAARIGRPIAEAELIEVYSCFPAAVRVQQRELGLDPSGTPTLTGGMAFAGGPFNNYVLQATAAMAGALRDQPDRLGVVTTVSGLLTKPGLAVWSGSPDGEAPLLGDLVDEATRVTGSMRPGGVAGGVRRAGHGGHLHGDPGRPPRDRRRHGGPWSRTVVVADTDDGRRCLAVNEDPGWPKTRSRRPHRPDGSGEGRGFGHLRAGRRPPCLVRGQASSVMGAMTATTKMLEQSASRAKSRWRPLRGAGRQPTTSSSGASGS